MGDPHRSGPVERDVEQAVTALKKGATLLKYGRIGKPKFCPFRLSNDESALIWYAGKDEKQLKLSQVSRIIPGQRTAIFQRYPRPEKEYQSFSLVYDDRTLDLICKDKDEAEVWFVALKALISKSGWRKWRAESRESSTSADGATNQRHHHSFSSFDAGDGHSHVPLEIPPQTGLGKAFSDIILYTSSSKSYSQVEVSSNLVTVPSSTSVDNFTCRSSSDNIRSSTSDNIRSSTSDNIRSSTSANIKSSTSDNIRSSTSDVRVSSSSVVSSSSHGSYHDDFESLGDVFIWGEGIGEGVLGGTLRDGSLLGGKFDALLPKALESTVVLDVHHIACGVRHAALVTRQGEIFSWGEESGGRLGHGVEVDISHPKLIDALNGMSIELVACGEYHTCAVTTSGDLFTWGGGACNSGMLGHGSEAGHWTPKRVCGPLDSTHVSYVSCGPWHTAIVASTGQLFTFGDGTFGVLGHGDRVSATIPREVEALRGSRALMVACGAWHTAAIVEILVTEGPSTASFGRSFSAVCAGKLFTWGEGDKGQLGHGDKEARLVPERVALLMDANFRKVACGRYLTAAVSTSGRVYTMGSPAYGQIGCPDSDGSIPVSVEGKIADNFVEDVACGSHHIAILTSKGEVFTWGKGSNGQLGHGDSDHRNEPTLVEFMKDKQVKSVACGSDFTAVVCLHKWVCGADHSSCTGCHNPFGFRRKRHNCYNCGQVFCKACSSRKSLKASLAPNMNKPYRVCDDCFVKLKKAIESGTIRIPRPGGKTSLQKPNDGVEKETLLPKFTGLSIVNSLKRTESGLSKNGSKLGKVESPVFPFLNGVFQPGSSNHSSSSSPIFGASNKRVSASAPGSRMVSRAASPIMQWSSPGSSTLTTSTSVPTSPDIMAPNSKHTNDSLGQEVIQLRAEVEKLSTDNHHLEAELEKTRNQLKEAKAIAVDEAEKSKAAKEVIKSLTSQLKEIAGKAQEGNRLINKLDSNCDQSFGPKNASRENHLTSIMSPRSESNMKTMDNILDNRTKQQPEKTEWVVQDEPGVYITLCSLPGGANELKRVRFSRKRFSEGQAEKWWAENSGIVCERHNIRNQ